MSWQNDGEAEELILSVINRVYQDGTTVELDRRCAREILTALKAHLWCPPDEFAAVVASAGGVDVQWRYLVEPPKNLSRVDRLSTPDGGFRLEAW